MVRSGSVREVAAYQPVNFNTDYDEWLAIQNGAAPKRQIQYDATPRYIATGRDLAEYIHLSPALGWAAALILATPGGGTDARHSGMFPPTEPVSYPSNPYRQSKTQGPAGGTFGLPYIQAVLATGISNSTRSAYWQKYFVHRVVRPEAYAGLANHRLANGVSDYPLHDNFLKSEALGRSKEIRHLSSVTDVFGSRAHSSLSQVVPRVGVRLPY
jgi:hypothetical protein